MFKETGSRSDGGFTDSAGDNGGPTKYGLSLRWLIAQGKLDPSFADAMDLNHDGKLDVVDVKSLTLAGAMPIYGRYFWLQPGFASLPPTFDAALFDEGVNGGTAAASKLLQLALNGLWRTALGLEPLTVDGQLGPTTRGRLDLSIAQKGLATSLAAYRVSVAARYRAIIARDPSQAQFKDGWFARASELGDV